MGFRFEAGDLGVLISVALMGLGVRLLRIARKHRGTPELLIGLYLLTSPPATSLVMRIPRFDPAWQEPLRFVAFLGLAVSALCLGGFAWRVFRPDAAWAKLLVGALAVYFSSLCAAILLWGSDFDLEARTLAIRAGLLVTYLWLFVECALHRRLLKRRLRLGLADPVVVNRFLLFEVWSGVLAVLPGLTLMLASLLTPEGAAEYGAFFAVVVRVTGFGIYASLWLSFLPPRAYTRWLQRRHWERHPEAAAMAGGD